MFEEIPGRLISGALWGLGAGLVLRVVGGPTGEPRGETAVRPLAKSLVKGYVVASERVRGLTAEARESLGDIYAEAQAERQSAGRGNGTAAAASNLVGGEDDPNAPIATGGEATRTRGRTTPRPRPGAAPE